MSNKPDQIDTEADEGEHSRLWPHVLRTFDFYPNRKMCRMIESKYKIPKILIKKVTFRETITGILLMIPAASTTMMTFYGVSIPLTEQGGDLVAKGQALAFAITIGVFSWLGWFYLFGLIYRMRKLRLTSTLMAGIVYVGVLAAVDAPFNTLSLAGGSGVQLTMVDTARYYEDKKISVFRQSSTMRKLLPALEAQTQRFANLKDGEVKFGTFSGKKGPGKVSAGFGQIAGLLKTLIAELRKGLSEAKLIQSKILSKFSTIKSSTYKTGPIRPRVENISNAADGMDDLLVELSQYDFSVSIKATLTSLNAIFPAPSNASSTFEQTQNSELAVISQMAKPVASALQTALKELEPREEISSAKSVRPLDAMAAIHAKWRELLPQWMAALFVDIGPSALLIMLIAGFRESEAREEELRPANDTKTSKTEK